MGILWGYFSSMLGRKARYDDPEFRAFLRRYQWSCLLLGKARATARPDEKQAEIWHADHGEAAEEYGGYRALQRASSYE